MTKKTFFEPTWKMLRVWRNIIDFPPEGYEFVTTEPWDEKVFAATMDKHTLFEVGKILGKLYPAGLAKSYIQKHKRLPAGVVLTYSHAHLVFRREPWVIEVESPHLILASHPKHFLKYRNVVQKSLASENCRRILCWSEVSRRSVVSTLSGLDSKISLVRLAVPPRNFTKETNSGNRVKLLFVGSTGILGAFDVKGGRELIEAFAALRQRYNNLELVIRSDVPADVRQQLRGVDNVRLIEKIIPWKMMEQEYQTSDIAVLPFHNSTPQTVLDAMSFELPVVGIGSWANPEYIEHMKTGLLVKPSEKVPYYFRDTYLPNFDTLEFLNAVRNPDSTVVAELVEKISLLIDNSELRRKLGKAGRHEVEAGKFSITVRNEKLKRIFDEAINT